MPLLLGLSLAFRARARCLGSMLVLCDHRISTTPCPKGALLGRLWASCGLRGPVGRFLGPVGPSWLVPAGAFAPYNGHLACCPQLFCATLSTCRQRTSSAVQWLFLVVPRVGVVPQSWLRVFLSCCLRRLLAASFSWCFTSGSGSPDVGSRATQQFSRCRALVERVGWSAPLETD